MAEAVLADRFRRRGLDVVVGSAGIVAVVGRPADPIAQALMKERGLDISAHRARQLTADLIRSCDLLLVMDREQQRAVESILPSARGRVHRIGRLGNFDVPDPYKGGRAAFERALVLIDRGVEGLEQAVWPARAS
jgi:low molecular weight protein-tyrosine phosphatase